MLGNWQEPMGGWCVERKAGRPFPPPRARPVISGVVDELSRLRPRLFERDLRRCAGELLFMASVLPLSRNSKPLEEQLMNWDASKATGKSSRARFNKSGASSP